MENKVSLAKLIAETCNSLSQNRDCNATSNVLSFMMLGDALIKKTEEITELSNDQLSNLAICISCLMTSDFVQMHPRFNIWSTGHVFAAVGFYAYMKQLDNSHLYKSHCPGFILLMHEGRKFIADLFQEIILGDKELSPYNPFDLLNFHDSAIKKYDVAKHFEYMLHVICANTGCADEFMNVWHDELKEEIDGIQQRLQTNNSLEYAKSLYKQLDADISNGVIPDYCLCS